MWREPCKNGPPTPPSTRPPTSFCPRPFSLHFPLCEADVLELVASFSRGQRLSRGSVEQLLDRHLELLQPLPNASVASCKALRPEHRTAAAPCALTPCDLSPHAPWHCRHARACAALGRRGAPPASLKGPWPDALPVTQPSPRRSPLGHGRHGRVAGCACPADPPPPPPRSPRWSASTCLRGRSCASSATCTASSRCAPPASYSRTATHCYALLLTHCHRALRMRVSATTGP